MRVCKRNEIDTQSTVEPFNEDNRTFESKTQLRKAQQKEALSNKDKELSSAQS
jgi:hypothetical protein